MNLQNHYTPNRNHKAYNEIFKLDNQFVPTTQQIEKCKTHRIADSHKET